jgi:hypothetical protein
MPKGRTIWQRDPADSSLTRRSLGDPRASGLDRAAEPGVDQFDARNETAPFTSQVVAAGSRRRIRAYWRYPLEVEAALADAFAWVVARFC